jgi:hypothetical protein
VEAGDELAVEGRAQPQVAGRGGYETAFLSMPEARLTL